ncbi:hypothetical protein R6Q59_003187 [Mikania micrantha]
MNLQGCNRTAGFAFAIVQSFIPFTPFRVLTGGSAFYNPSIVYPFRVPTCDWRPTGAGLPGSLVVSFILVKRLVIWTHQRNHHSVHSKCIIHTAMANHHSMHSWLLYDCCRFQANVVVYHNLITQSMYDKQLDSGKDTLLHLCDDVIQLEVDSSIFFLINNPLFLLVSL